MIMILSEWKPGRRLEELQIRPVPGAHWKVKTKRAVYDYRVHPKSKRNMGVRLMAREA